jgi:hypothetical protein
MKILRSRWRRVLTAVLFSTAVLNAETPHPITIGVSPPRVEMEIGARPTTEAIRVFNFGSEPMGVSVSVVNWELDGDNRLAVLEPTEHSLDRWMVINPLRFTVEPGGFQTVRFSVRPKVEPPTGEYRAMVYFQQDPGFTQAAERPVRVVGRIGVAIYGYVGEIERTGNLNRVSVDAEGALPEARFDISNTGNAHVRMLGQYSIWSADAYPGADKTNEIEHLGLEQGLELPLGMIDAGVLPGLPVLPDARRQLLMRVGSALAPGKYVLDINGDLSGEPLDLGVPFTVGSTELAQGEGN